MKDRPQYQDKESNDRRVFENLPDVFCALPAAATASDLGGSGHLTSAGMATDLIGLASTVDSETTGFTIETELENPAY